MKKIIAIIALALSANTFASTSSEINIQPPVLVGMLSTGASTRVTDKISSLGATTCRLVFIDADNKKHELDPMFLGEAERKAGHFNINPYQRYAGSDKAFHNFNDCIAIAGMTAQHYGIRQVIMSTAGSDELIVSVRADYIDNGQSTRVFKSEFVVMDGCDTSKFRCRVESNVQFHVINRLSNEWSQNLINQVRAVF